ncbi:MAG: extracellular solute-binding protein [Roseburia sp.]|nr:extracellular solute-binding protein [Roseburia sp.]
MTGKWCRKKKTASVLLSLVLLITFLGGCGNTGTGQDIKGNTEQTGNAGHTAAASTQDAGAETAGNNTEDTQDASDEAAAMGRYVEEVTDLSEKLSGWRSRLFRLADGTLMITDPDAGFLVSKDNGVTWEEEKPQWFTGLKENDTYIVDIAIGADNTTAVLYIDYEGENYGQSLMVIKADGSEFSVKRQDMGDQMFPGYAAVSDEGRVFFSVSGSDDLYEATGEGGYEVFLTLPEGRPELIKFQGNLLIMDGNSYQSPRIYDMERKEYVEDEVLETFVKEDYNGGNSFNTDDGYELYFFAGEENVIYLAGSKGLHRHVVGGSAIEQVIDGRLCTFNNPAYYIQSVLMLPDNKFLALFSGGRLVHFVYDPDMPTVPNERLYIYSLKENSTIQQAVSLYQTANPETFVEYEVGLSDGSSLTREDALKTLNTKIMAGEGPDVLVLDDMPIDSYIEKGLLLDMATILSELSGEEALFGNIVEAMKTGESVYAMPCEIQIPVIGGDEQYISQMDDLEGIADTVEIMRQENPGEDILGLSTEKAIMRFFAMACTPAWLTEDGELNTEAVREFLEQTKRIYDAQMEGLPEKILNQYRTGNENWLQYFGESRDDSGYLRTAASAENYVWGERHVVREAINGRNAYNELCSVNKVAGYEESVWRPIEGQSSHVFCAYTLLGINATSRYSKQAEDFIRICLGKENQTMMYQGNPYNGFAVNKAAFEEDFTTKPDYIEESGAYLWMGGSDEDGKQRDFVAYWPDEAQIAEIRACIEAADTPYIEDTVLEYAVYDEGIGYLQGRKSLDEAMTAIERKISLYLAE